MKIFVVSTQYLETTLRTGGSCLQNTSVEELLLALEIVH